MRNNILSFCIAIVVGTSVLGAVHVLKDERSGHALAAPSTQEIRTDAKPKHRTYKKTALSPDYLMNLTGREVTDLLKTPGLVRKDFPTVVWQYRNEICVLDVYFQSSSEDVSAKKVIHYEIRSRGDEDMPISAGQCTYQLVQAGGSIRMVDVSAIYKAP